MPIALKVSWLAWPLEVIFRSGLVFWLHPWGVEFSKVASANWIFDVEIEKLSADFFFACRED
jgi:hypothetical protein